MVTMFLILELADGCHGNGNIPPLRGYISISDIQNYNERLLFTGLHSCLCMSDMCWNSLSLFSYHLSELSFLDPLVESLVTCQRLTSLELKRITLSLQSWIKLVKELHNLRALGLESVSMSDERVSD